MRQSAFQPTRPTYLLHIFPPPIRDSSSGLWESSKIISAGAPVFILFWCLVPARGLFSLCTTCSPTHGFLHYLSVLIFVSSFDLLFSVSSQQFLFQSLPSLSKLMFILFALVSFTSHSPSVLSSFPHPFVLFFGHGSVFHTRCDVFLAAPSFPSTSPPASFKDWPLTAGL